MNLLFLNHNLREHGTFFRAFHLARELVRRGHSVTLWCASPSHWYRTVHETLDGVQIVETPSWNPILGRDEGWGPLDLAWRSLNIFRQRFDLVYAFAHPPTVSFIARLARKFRHVPVVVDWCDVYLDGIFPLREEIRAYQNARGWRLGIQRRAERIESRLERSVLRWADGVTVISGYLADEARNAGISEDHLLRYPSGANLDAIRPMDKPACRAELRSRGVEVTDDELLLGYVANYNPDERFFLAALGEFFAQRPEARLLAACPDFTSSLIERHSVRDRIIMLGRRPFAEINSILGAANILLLPLDENVSNKGRWPNKFGDYLAAGRPIAACAVGDVAEYFERGGSAESVGGIGLLSQPDVSEYARAIGCLADRASDHPAMGLAARQLAEGTLAWPGIAERVEAFLASFVRS